MKIICQWVLGALLGLLPLNLQGLHYKIQDLGTLETEKSYATGINNQNCVIGIFKSGENAIDFMWEPNKGLTALPSLGPLSAKLNNHNQLATVSWYRTNYWIKSNTRFKQFCIHHPDGSIQNLGAPEGWEIQHLSSWQTSSVWDDKELGVVAFNDHQQVLVANASQIEKATRFAVWDNGAFKELDTNKINHAYGMNNEGVILGRKWVQTERGNTPILVLYNPVEDTTIEIMKDINLLRRALNDQGQVIVFQAVKDQTMGKGYLWDPSSGLTDLGDFAPMAFNNYHQIVGVQISELQNKKVVPLLWTPEGILPLNDFLNIGTLESLWSEITSVQGINDNGYIIGEGTFDGKQHGFVLIPQ